MDKAKYRFVGQGLGVPGLPHEVTAEQAQQWEAEYKARRKELEVEYRQKAKDEGRDFGEADEMDIHNALFGLQGFILKAALENGNYAKATGQNAPDVEEGE